jgi:hypothetical protein
MFPTRPVFILTLATALIAAAARVPSNSVTRVDGAAVRIGGGQARSYVLYDKKTGAPIEVGVAMGELALDSLPTGGSGHAGMPGMDMHSYILPLPQANKTPFRFVELNWNPAGHEPDGVYQNVPHFDFHFYTISKKERDAIVPSNPEYATKANNIPAADFAPQFNAALGPPGMTPAQFAVPMMGVHWVDTRSPELQKLFGHPEAFKPFTTTFLHGSWDGQFTFWEPMITRAYIVSKKSAAADSVRDEKIALPLPKKYKIPGYYPAAYRITWDGVFREYRIALTDLQKR